MHPREFVAIAHDRGGLWALFRIAPNGGLDFVMWTAHETVLLSRTRGVPRTLNHAPEPHQ